MPNVHIDPLLNLIRLTHAEMETGIACAVSDPSRPSSMPPIALPPSRTSSSYTQSHSHPNKPIIEEKVSCPICNQEFGRR